MQLKNDITVSLAEADFNTGLDDVLKAKNLLPDGYRVASFAKRGPAVNVVLQPTTNRAKVHGSVGTVPDSAPAV